MRHALRGEQLGVERLRQAEEAEAVFAMDRQRYVVHAAAMHDQELQAQRAAMQLELGSMQGQRDQQASVVQQLQAENAQLQQVMRTHAETTTKQFSELHSTSVSYTHLTLPTKA